MKAMILAAGEGTRLRPLTLTKAKPVCPVAGKPLLAHTLSWLRSQGVKEAVINLSYRPEDVRGLLGDGAKFGIRLSYSLENTVLGTSGGVRHARSHFDEDFWVIYGDNLYGGSLESLAKIHKQLQAVCTIGLFRPDDPSSCGIVKREGAVVTGFLEKPTAAQIQSLGDIAANAGIYLLSPALVDRIPQGFSDFGNDCFPTWLSEGVTIVADYFQGTLVDTGSLASYIAANALFGSVQQGNGCVIAPSAKLDHVVFWDNCVVGERCTIARSAIADNCVLGADCRLIGCILGSNVRVGDGAQLVNARIQPGTTVPPGESIIIESG
jgi:mannose-1-phosphate guanylyltransferase/phosphomannomutase